MIWVIRNGQEIVSNNNFEFHYGFFQDFEWFAEHVLPANQK